MAEDNEILKILVSLKSEWDRCDSRIAQIKKELEPFIVQRFKQLGYEESYEDYKVKIAPRKYETKKVLKGFVSWYEDFKDAGTGDITTIKRRQIVMQDGEYFIGTFSLDALINWESNDSSHTNPER